MSTQHANEATPQGLAGTGPARRPPLRPHLVSAGERRLSSDGQAESAVAFDRAAVGMHSFDPRWEETPVTISSEDGSADLALFGSKRALDVLGAVVLAVVFSPLILAIVIVALLRREGGSIIYKHRRVCQDGRSFECLKFRTMVPNADQVLRELLERATPRSRRNGCAITSCGCDPRVTRLGRFLRRTSLDELPQLWNVLRGEMSLVGPRPVVREELLSTGGMSAPTCPPNRESPAFGRSKGATIRIIGAAWCWIHTTFATRIFFWTCIFW